MLESRWAEGRGTAQGSRLGLELPSSFSLEASGLHKAFRERVGVILLTTFPHVCPACYRLPSVETSVS